jgi:hypothetical protein
MNTSTQLVNTSSSILEHIADLVPEATFLPLNEGTKVPATHHGYKDAAPIFDVNWTGNTGWVLSGNPYFGIDVDTKKKYRGATNLCEFLNIALPQGATEEAAVNKLVEALDTLIVQTPSGGLHIIWKHAKDCVLNWQRPPSGCEYRGAVGYLCAPGSRLQNGEYTIVKDLPVAVAPPQILDALERPTEKKKSTGILHPLTDHPLVLRDLKALLKARPAAIGGDGTGTGYNESMATVRLCHDMGASEEAALELLMDVWAERCDPPWEAGELQVKISDWYRGCENGHGSSISLIVLFDINGWPLIDDAENDNELQAEIKSSNAEDLFPIFAEHEGLEGPPLDYVIKDILPLGYQVMLYGEEQSLKTYAMLEMMECAMTGIPFAQVPGDSASGYPVVKPGISAMLICGEGFEGVKKQRHPLWRKHHGIPSSKALPFYTMNVMPSFLDSSAVEKLAQSIKAQCGSQIPDIIGIDTLVYALAPDGKEDSNDDATKIYNAGKQLTRLLDKPLVIIWVHHVGHSAKRTRGAYNWQGSSDIRFRLEHVKSPVNDGNGGRSYHVRMVCEKLKDAPRPEPIEFKGRTVFDNDKDGNTISTVLLSGVPTGSLIDRAESSAGASVVQETGELTKSDVVLLVLDKADAGQKLSPGEVSKEAMALGLTERKASTFERGLRNMLSKPTAKYRADRRPLEGLYSLRTMHTKDGEAWLLGRL